MQDSVKKYLVAYRTSCLLMKEEAKSPEKVKSPVEAKSPEKEEAKSPEKAKSPVKEEAKSPEKAKSPVEAKSPEKAKSPVKEEAKSPEKAKSPCSTVGGGSELTWAGDPLPSHRALLLAPPRFHAPRPLSRRDQVLHVLQLWADKEPLRKRG